MADWFWIASLVVWALVALFILLDEPVDRLFAKLEQRRYRKKKYDK